VVLAFQAPRLAGSEALRDTIARASTDMLGAPLRYEALRVGLLPPRLELRAPSLPAADPEAPPLLAADRVSLRIALWPLLAWTLLLDRVEIDGLEASLVRTRDGITWPEPPPDPATPEGAGDGESASDDGSIRLAVSRIDLRNARIELIDRAVSPAVAWRLESVDLEARGGVIARRLEIRGTATSGDGGQLRLEGTSTLDGELDLRLHLDAVALASTAAYAGEGVTVGATVSGEVSVKGPAAAPERTAARLVLDARDLRIAAAAFAGRASVDASWPGDPTRTRGTFSVDATSMRMAFGTGLVKPAGTHSELRGRISIDEGGEVDVVLDHVGLARMEAKGRVRIGESVSVSLDAPPFDPTGLQALLVAGAPADLSGRMSLRAAHATFEPLRISGEARLDGVRIGLPSGGAVEVSGSIVGRGRALELADMVLRIGGQPFGLAGRLDHLVGPRRFTVRLSSQGVVRSESVLSGVDPSLANTLSGPMILRGDLAGRLGDEEDATSILDSLTGSLSIDVGRNVGDGGEGGRVRGFSAFREVVRGLDQIGSLTRLDELVPGDGGSDLAAYTSDEFDELAVHFAVADGAMQTERVRIQYGGYALRLQGRILLGDRSLDMSGELELGEKVVAQLGGGAKSKGLTVPVAHVGGTLAEPDVTVSKAAVVSLTGQLLSLAPPVKLLTDQAEKAFPGAGRTIRRGIDELLGTGEDAGARRRGGSAGAPADAPATPPAGTGAEAGR
jgi:hypothetical protein